jgi:hypothetical protein
MEQTHLDGIPEDLTSLQQLIFSGEEMESGRPVTAQAPSGSGALSMIGQFMKNTMSCSTIHLPQSTWEEHNATFNGCGLTPKGYSHCESETGGFDFEGLLKAVDAMNLGEAILLPSCKQNPTDIGPTREQWQTIVEAITKKSLIPVLDTAYPSRSMQSGEECVVDDSDDGEMSIKELLQRYGVVAILFHFSVWTSCMALGYTVLSIGDPVKLISALPPTLRQMLPMEASSEGAAMAEGLAVFKLQLSLGICEVIGPARFALTAVATPTVSTFARQSDIFCELENGINSQLKKIPFLAPEKTDDELLLELLEQSGLEYFVAQSLEEDFGVYDEDTSFIHVRCANNEVSAPVLSQLKRLVWQKHCSQLRRDEANTMFNNVLAPPSLDLSPGQTNSPVLAAALSAAAPGVAAAADASGGGQGTLVASVNDFAYIAGQAYVAYIALNGLKGMADKLRND